MSKNNSSASNASRPSSQPTTYTRDNGGGAPGPKYSIPVPPPKPKK